MRCPACLFSADAWTDEDLVRTLAAYPRWWRELVEHIDDALLAVVAPHAAVVAALPRRAADADAVHRGWHALADAGRALHAAGGGARRQTGSVVQVSTSDGGVPKRPVPRAQVRAGGLAGDRQATRRHHGRPWQALCLWSAEVVDGLAAQGHPIGYGCAGENLTLGGLDWRQVRPGVRMRIGTALVETTSYAVPCAKNARWFADGDPMRIGHRRRPGTSRIYARVLEDGVVTAGDPVVVEPGPVPAQRAAVAGRAADVPSSA